MQLGRGQSEDGPEVGRGFAFPVPRSGEVGRGFAFLVPCPGEVGRGFALPLSPPGLAVWTGFIVDACSDT
jgi:hypothetical protein